MKALASMPKKARRKVAKTSRVAPSGRHPLHPQITALVNPFVTSPGIAQHLIDAMPSQKYTVRSRTSVSVASAGSILGLLSPYCWNDSANYPSGIVYAGATTTIEASLVRMFNDPTAGSLVSPAGITTTELFPVRPWASGNGRTARLVSYGLRVRYTGTALNANGTFKLLATPHGEIDMTGFNPTTFNGIISNINSNHQTQMKSIYDRAVYTFNFIGNDGWSQAGTGADQDEDVDVSVVGQAGSAKRMSEPGAFFYYLNNAGSTVQFEIELIENWEVRGSTVAPFYTDSHSAPELHHEIMNTISTAHMKAGASGESFSKVVSTVAKASKSPLGKAVLAAALA